MDYYAINCDSCSKLYEDKSNKMSAWPYEDYAENLAVASKWIKILDKHLCPECYEYDKDGNLVLKPKFN